MSNRTDFDNMDMKGFTLAMALVDALPVLLFGASSIVVSLIFKSTLFTIGACLCIGAGFGKVLWKIIIAGSRRNIFLLNRQLRYLMPLGFLLIILSVILEWESISFSAIIHALTGFPAVIFFIIGIIGMAAMCCFAIKLDGRDPKSNWIEQITNTIAQAAFLIGLLIIR